MRTSGYGTELKLNLTADGVYFYRHLDLRGILRWMGIPRVEINNLMAVPTRNHIHDISLLVQCL